MLVFRTEASPEIGFHRLQRCMYLAALVKKKTAVTFWVNKDKRLIDSLREKKFSFTLAEQVQEPNEKETRGIVFDLEHFKKGDIERLHRAKEKNIPTIQVSDPGLQRREADYTIDASIEKKNAADTEKGHLYGPEYAILHHKYRHFHKVKRKYRKRIKNIFLPLGDTVPYRTLREIVDLLCRYRFNLKITPGYQLKKSHIKVLKRIYGTVRFVGKPESLARSYFEADLAVVIPGPASFEAAATGTPSLYLCFDNREEEIAGHFEKIGAGLKVRYPGDSLKEDIKEKIGSLTVARRIEMGTEGKRSVDAGGAHRIIDFFKKKDIM